MKTSDLGLLNKRNEKEWGKHGWSEESRKKDRNRM